MKAFEVVDDVYAVAFSPNGCQILTSNGERAKLWDSSSGALVNTFEVPLKGPVRLFNVKAIFSPDGTGVAIGCNSGIKLFDSRSGAMIRTFEQIFASSFAFSPDGQYLATASQRGQTLVLWDVSSGRQIGIFGHLKSHSVVFSPCGRHIASGASSALVLWRNVLPVPQTPPCPGPVRSTGAHAGATPFFFPLNADVFDMSSINQLVILDCHY